MATFVLVHGAFTESWSWHKVVPFLMEAGHRVVTPDLPGHGQNRDMDITDATPETYGRYVAEVLAQQPDPVILVGHSMGGTVISQAAEFRPEKVRKLVYVAAFLLKDGQSLASRGGGHLDPLHASHDVLKDQLYADCSDEDVRLAQACMVPEARGVATSPIHITDANYGRLPRVYIECLRDHAIPPEMQKQMYTDMPCERVITMDTSHSPNLAAPQELARNLLSVL